MKFPNIEAEKTKKPSCKAAEKEKLRRMINQNLPLDTELPFEITFDNPNPLNSND